MSNRSLAILAALVLILGGFIWFFERHEPTTDEADELAKKIFTELDVDDVGGLEIGNSHGVFTFARTGDGWRLTAPLEAAADSLAVDGVVSAILELEVERRFSTDDVEADPYGIDEPDLRVTLISNEGAHHRLAIGGTTPLGGKRAVSRDGGGIILTSGAFAGSLDKELDDWRSRKVLDARLADLVSIDITTGGDRIDAIEVGGVWRLRAPIVDLADAELLRIFVTDITSLRIEAFVDDEVDFEAMGLTHPRHRIMMVPADGGESTTLDFGSTRDVDGATEVACRLNGSNVYWVNDRAETVLGKAPVRWREPQVRPFETWEASKLEIVNGDESVVLHKASGLWTIDGDQDADAASVEEKLSALAGLEVVDFDLMDLGTPELGRVTVSLGDSDGEELTFNFQEALGEGGNVLVRVTGRDVLMSVRPDAAERILGNLDALRPTKNKEEDNLSPADSSG